MEMYIYEIVLRGGIRKLSYKEMCVDVSVRWKWKWVEFLCEYILFCSRV